VWSSRSIFFLQSGIISGELFPQFTQLGFSQMQYPEPKLDDAVAVTSLRLVLPDPALALLVVWSFLAGFSESKYFDNHRKVTSRRNREYQTTKTVREKLAISTDGPMGKMVLTVLGMVAEMELGFIEARQRDGIERAKSKGDVSEGRKPTIDRSAVRDLFNEGIGASEIARRLKIGRASVYRVLEL
jgi:hypothetical protein